MEKARGISGYFSGVETTKKHEGYFCSVGETLTIVILGNMCGLRNVSQIQQWASNERVKLFLWEQFGIASIPCYYWMLCLLKIICPKSLHRCFMNWVQSLIAEDGRELTLSFDGKTICSTEKMERYDSLMHIVSAQIAELGIPFGQQTVYDKSNEIPAVRELLLFLHLNIRSNMTRACSIKGGIA